jgi:hypothetical protein
METIRTVLVAWKRLKQESIVFDTWWLKPQEWSYQSCKPWYVYPDMFDALNCYEHLYDDCWTIVKIFLCTFEELRICSVCRSDKWFIAICYIDFITYTENLISILDYLFWFRRWHNKMEESSMITWMSSNVKHCDGHCNEG